MIVPVVVRGVIVSGVAVPGESISCVAVPPVIATVVAAMVVAMVIGPEAAATDIQADGQVIPIVVMSAETQVDRVARAS
jgi:hypothetical protein